MEISLDGEGDPWFEINDWWYMKSQGAGDSVIVLLEGIDGFGNEIKLWTCEDGAVKSKLKVVSLELYYHFGWHRNEQRH